MPKDKLNESWAVKVLGLALEGIAIIIFNSYLRLWRFFKYRILGLKDWRIIYGETITKRQIFDYPKRRNQHTYIKGKTGFGKSGLAINLAVQCINHGTRTLFIDPHGDPGDKNQSGAILDIYKRVKNPANIVFLSVNQTTKVIGSNPLFTLGSLDKLDETKDDLLNALFYDTTAYQVLNRAVLVLESAIYFHNCYVDWLLFKLNKGSRQIKSILQQRQITFNDLANLLDNQGLIELFIKILGFKESKYQRPDLVLTWLKIKDIPSPDVGLKGVAGRLARIVSSSRSKLFFESTGFSVLEKLKMGKSVLCDISKLDDFTTAIITKLILSKVWTMHRYGFLRGQTEMFIDEAANAEIPNLPQIITQGRKKKLALTLIFQFTRQFKNPDLINSILNTIVTKINFRNGEPDSLIDVEKLASLKEREFVIETNYGIYDQVFTLDMPPILRDFKLTERGVDKAELRARISAKRTDILAYFLNV
jgi:DNA helicase HerA-like ATPase